MKLNKVGILNFQHSNHNYGAVLQAAALQYSIDRFKSNINSEHINFDPFSGFRYTLKKLTKNILSITGIRKDPDRFKLINHHGYFELFRNNHIRRSKNKINSGYGLERAFRKYDIVLVGSDQVWRPDYSGKYALNFFICNNKDTPYLKKVSYAASFGKDTWDDGLVNNNELSLIRESLNDFHAISVREKSGVSICKDVFSVEAQHVLDPTLLAGIEYFDTILSGYTSKTKDLVYYKLDKTEEFQNVVNSIAIDKRFSVEDIFYTDNGFHKCEYWLQSIKNAEIVITDSFHCVCLSILYNKKFVCIGNSDRGLARVESLLESLGIDINELMVYEDEIKNLPVRLERLKNIDYEEVNKKLELLRISSNDFLKRALLSS